MVDTADEVGSAGIAAAPKARRLYRGLTRPYDAARVVPARFSGTDFTDCPFTALQYARGPKGVVLVLDVPAEHRRFSEELWLGTRAKRYMLWGEFDEFLVAELAAKELRAHVRQKGVVGASDDYKAVLRRPIRERLSCR